MTPVRVQLRRTKGWKLPENTVKVDRSTKWGNPFLVHPQHRPGRVWGIRMFSVPTTADAVACFREMMDSPGEAADALRASLPELRGKNLACWCPLPEPGEPDLCHADVLLDLANRLERDT